MQIAKITPTIRIGQNQPLALIAGPCVIENETMMIQTAETLVKLTEKLKIPFIFKSSYKKANRMSIDSFSTIGIEKALAILAGIKSDYHVPILTDIHEIQEAKLVAEIADIIQIPAFLCRQTDLIIAAATTGKAVNLKKGQFMAPEDMHESAQKAIKSGNPNVLLTERGASFGYHNLVVDMRALIIMRDLGYPVIFDATHSTQLPGGAGKSSSGKAEYALPLARAAIATGACHAIFVETHPNPETAMSDAKTQIPLTQMEDFVSQILDIFAAVHSE